jgi:hypothetical protein
MAGIIIAAYQKDVTGWGRIAALGLGSFLVFALTVESIKKRQHMDAISRLLKDLQGSGGLELPDAFIFPVGLSYDIEIYLARKLKEDKLKDGEQKHHDKIFDFFEVFYARKVLTLVVFVSAIVVAGLADYEFVNFFHNQWPQIALRIPMAIAIIVPLIILGIVLYDQKTNKEIIQETIKKENSRKENKREKSGGAPTYLTMIGNIPLA